MEDGHTVSLFFSYVILARVSIYQYRMLIKIDSEVLIALPAGTIGRKIQGLKEQDFTTF